MVANPPVNVRKLTRYRNRPEDGGRTLYFKADVGRLGRFLGPDEVPQFEGDEAWFEIEGFKHGSWRVLRQVLPPSWSR